MTYTISALGVILCCEYGVDISEDSGSHSFSDASEDELQVSDGGGSSGIRKQKKVKDSKNVGNALERGQHTPSSSRRSRGQANASAPGLGSQGFNSTTAPHYFPSAPGWTFVPIPQTNSAPNMHNFVGGYPSGNYPINWQMLQTPNLPQCPDSAGTGSRGNDVGSVSVPTSLKEDSAKRRIRRANKRDADEVAKKRELAGLKPYVVHVKSSGIIDSGCVGHLKWQENIREVTPRMLDMSVIKYEDQYEGSKIKLREGLRQKFEFVGNEVSDDALDRMVKTWLRKDRERMKKTHGGKLKAPPHFTDKEWDSMRKYWDSEDSKKLSEKMMENRSKVTNNPRVGRRGYAGKKTKLVSLNHTYNFSCSIRMFHPFRP